MQNGRSTVERAFELAREGQCRSIGDIRRKLGSERYDAVDAHLGGAAIKKQLQVAIEAASRPAAAE
jgi:hypothetical protein